MSRRQIVLGALAVVGTLVLFVNPLGLWVFIPFAVLGVWVEVGNLILSYQMRAELRQVLNQQ